MKIKKDVNEKIEDSKERKKKNNKELKKGRKINKK